jgi:lipid-A-disaccharide synthase
VVAGLPRTFAMYRRLVASARDERPDVFVAIDFPDFNLRLASAIKRLGIPVVYYVSPQLWAWRPGRIHTVRRVADRMLVIFPFEAKIYEDAGVPVEFVGHPLLELARTGLDRPSFLSAAGLDPGALTVALLPGSRPNEVRTLLPDLCRAAELLASRLPGLQFVVARAPNVDATAFEPATALEQKGTAIRVVAGQADAVLSASDVVVTASGTATVQAAIHGRPMVIVYRLSPLTYTLGKRFVRVDTFGMVNLVAGRKIVPELIQNDLTPEAVASEASRFFTDAAYYEQTKLALADVKNRLGGWGASRRAAEAVLAVARGAGVEQQSRA